MAVRSYLSGYLHRGVRRWKQRRTNRIVQNLPLEIQKDIGWPRDEEAQRRKLDEHESFWERQG